MTEVTYLFVFEIAKIRAKTKQKREKTGQQFIKKVVNIMAQTKKK